MPITQWLETKLDWHPSGWQVLDVVDGHVAHLSVWPIAGGDGWFGALLTTHTSQRQIGQFPSKVQAMVAAERALSDAIDSAESGTA